MVVRQAPANRVRPAVTASIRNTRHDDRSITMAGEHRGHANTRDLRSQNLPVPSSSIHILPLSDLHVEAAARLYSEVFLADEPTSRRHALDLERFYPHACFYVQSLVNKGLSFLARDECSGEITGFIFCFDLVDDLELEGPEMKDFLIHFQQAVAMIDELEARHFHRESVIPGSVLHIFQIGVARKVRGRGITRALIRRALTHAKERRFTQAVADCTTPASKYTFERCGFSERGFYSYESFCMDNVCFFSGLEGGIFLMVKDLHPAV